jgi:enterochelin esterase-like enzyme
MGDVVPYIEKNFRVIADRNHRALAGLSMGGSQTLNVGFDNLDRFAYLGVFSSGLIGSFGAMRPATPAATPLPPPPAGPSWEERRKANLDNPALKKGLKLLWFATGKEDFLLQTTHKTVDLLKAHGFNPVYKETEGGHTWLNWRDYLGEFAPKLFQ